MFATTNQMMSDPAYKAAIRAFAMENEQLVQKLGVQEEALDDLFVDDDVEKEADSEIDQVMSEVLGQKFAKLGAIQKPVQQENVEDETFNEAKARLANM